MRMNIRVRARRLLALLLTLVLLTGLFCSTGLTMAAAAAGTTHTVTFDANGAVSSGDITVDGYYDDVNGAAVRGYEGHIVSASDMGVSGDSHSLQMTSSNDRLIMRVPANTFGAEDTVLATVRYYFPTASSAYTNQNVTFGVWNSGFANGTHVIGTSGTTGTVQSMSLPLSGSDINDKELWIRYNDDSSDTDAFSVCILDVELTTDTCKLTLTANGGGTVTGGGVYKTNTTATLTATPNVNGAFAGWYKDDALYSADATTTYTMTEDAALEARFTSSDAESLQAAVNAAETRLVGYTPESRDAYNAALANAKAVLAANDSTKIAQAYAQLMIAQAGLTTAQGTAGYASVDFRSGTPEKVNVTAENRVAGDSGYTPEVSSFSEGLSGLLLDRQNQGLQVVVADGVFEQAAADGNKIKVTVHYYYTDEDTSLNSVPSNERLYASPRHYGDYHSGQEHTIFKADGNGTNSSETWLFQQEDTLVTYIADDDVDMFIKASGSGYNNSVNLIHLLHGNTTDNGKRDLYIVAVELEAVETYELTLGVNLAGGGTVTGAGAYAVGETVQLTATPASNDYAFIGWYDANDVLVSDEQNYTYTMPNKAVQLTAKFATGDIEGLQNAVNNAKTWLVPYMPSSRTAYLNALEKAKAVLKNGGDYGAALAALEQADGSLVVATDSHTGYGYVDFRDGGSVSGNTASGKNDHDADGKVNSGASAYQGSNQVPQVENFTDSEGKTHYGVSLKYHNQVFRVEPEQAAFSGLKTLKLTVHYYYESTLSVDQAFDYVPTSERLTVRRRHIDNNAAYTVFQADGSNTNSEEVWLLRQEDTLVTYVEVSENFFNGNSVGGSDGDINLIRELADNDDAWQNTGDRKLYITAVEMEAVAEIPTFEVTAQSAGNGTVSGGGTFNSTQVITLTATANDGYTFMGWYDANGIKVSSDKIYTIPANTLNANATYTARFGETTAVEVQFDVNNLDDAGRNQHSGHGQLDSTVDGTAKLGILTNNASAVLPSEKSTLLLELSYYLEAFEVDEDGNPTNKPEGTETITIRWGDDNSFVITPDTDRSVLTTLTVELYDFDPEDVLTLEYANGTVMHVTAAKLYSEDTPNEYLYFTAQPKVITLPVTIRDYIPNGLLFQSDQDTQNAANHSFALHFEGHATDVVTYAANAGIELDSLVEDTLYDDGENRHVVYKPIVIEYLAETALTSSEFFSQLIANLGGTKANTTISSGSGDDTWDDAWLALIDKIKDIQANGETGSWDETSKKLGNINGAPMLLNDAEDNDLPYVTTLYDAAYYMLNTLFVTDEAYNMEEKKLTQLQLQADGTGWYIYDSGYETDYDTSTGAIQNTDIIAPDTPLIYTGLNSDGVADTVVNEFFPLNGRGYDDKINIAGDQLEDNFSFTMHGHGLFVYDAEQVFTFTGDDDVYLFVNGYRVLKIDGTHSRQEVTVRLSEIAGDAGLAEGQTYTFDFYYMERHTYRSNLKIYTNIEILPPVPGLEKNAYKNEDYAAEDAYAAADICPPFTKVYYEFVMDNSKTESADGVNNLHDLYELHISDPKLGVEFGNRTTIDPDTGAVVTEPIFQLNDMTEVEDLVLILEDHRAVTAGAEVPTITFAYDNRDPVGATYNVEGTDAFFRRWYQAIAELTWTDAETYEGALKAVLKEGLPVGWLLKVRGVQQVITEDLPNTVYLDAHYNVSESDVRTMAGESSQTMMVFPGDYTLTVDYGIPLQLRDTDAFGHMERVMDLRAAAVTTLNNIKLLDDEGNEVEGTTISGDYGTLTWTKDGIYGISNPASLRYVLDREMTGEDVFTLKISSAFIREGEGTNYVPTNDTSATYGIVPMGGAGCDTDAAGNPRIRDMNAQGAYAKSTVRVDAAGTYLLTLTYSNAGADAVNMILTVGADTWEIQLPSTGTWNDYREITFLVELAEGVNDVKFETKTEADGARYGFNIGGLRVVEAEENTSDDIYYEKKVTFVPANNIYYEDEFVVDALKGMGEKTGSGWTNTDPDNGDSDTRTVIYPDFTLPAHGASMAFDRQNTYSNGSALEGKGKNDANDLTKLTFSFTGTGVDIYSSTTPETGEIRVQLKQEGVLKAVRYVDCEYASGNMYQIPVVSFLDLPFGTYTVEILVYHENNLFSGARHTFYFEGVRVYNPLGGDPSSVNGREVYAKENELGASFINLRQVLLSAEAVKGITGPIAGKGVVYYDYKRNETGEIITGDGKNTCDPVDYEALGPDNEVYLAPGQSIAFTVDSSYIYTDIQVAAKSAHGGTLTFDVNGTTYTIDSTMDMYYSLPIAEGTHTYTIQNTSSDATAILSLTKVKLTNRNAVLAAAAEAPMAAASLVVTEDTVAYATAVLNGDTETAAALADKMAAQNPPREQSGSATAGVTPSLPQASAPITPETQDEEQSSTYTAPAQPDADLVAEAEEKRAALIQQLLS